MTDVDIELQVPPPGAGEPMLELLHGFIRELREAGLPVSTTEHLDSMQAIKHIPLEDRAAFKYALAATLVKNNAHWRAFETVFEVYFSLRGKEFELRLDEDGEPVEGEDGADQQEGEGQSGQAGVGRRRHVARRDRRDVVPGAHGGRRRA